MENTIGFTIRHIKNWIQYMDKFWELHPSATKMGPLKKLYKGDRNPNKLVSSKKMWFCVLYCHPESDFYNLDHVDKVQDLAPDLFLPSVKAEEMFKKLSPCIDYIRKGVLTKSHKHLAVLHKKLDERDNLYDETPYTLETVEILDKMIKSEPTLMKAVQECEDIIKESSKDGALKGGGELSLMEGGTLFD